MSQTTAAWLRVIVDSPILAKVVAAVKSPQSSGAEAIAAAVTSKADMYTEVLWVCMIKQTVCQVILLPCPALPCSSCLCCLLTLCPSDQERYVHVYLPPAFDGTTQWPIWVHLHGVFWATMGDIGARVREGQWFACAAKVARLVQQLQQEGCDVYHQQQWEHACWRVNFG